MKETSHTTADINASLALKDESTSICSSNGHSKLFINVSVFKLDRSIPIEIIRAYCYDPLVKALVL